jgi:hypothetical protein
MEAAAEAAEAVAAAVVERATVTAVDVAATAAKAFVGAASQSTAGSLDTRHHRPHSRADRSIESLQDTKLRIATALESTPNSHRT